MTHGKIAIAFLFSLAVLLGGCLGYEEYAAVEPPSLTLDDDFEIFGGNPSDWSVGEPIGGNPSDWGVGDPIYEGCRYFDAPGAPRSAADEDIKGVKSNIRAAKKKLEELEELNGPSGSRGGPEGGGED
jgi:hypothetical protein